MSPARKARPRGASISNACPVCDANPGEPCTRVTDGKRQYVTWYHFGRLPVIQERES